MHNKTLLYLIFLSFSLATQCMENKSTELIIPQPKSMRELLQNYDAFKKDLDDNGFFWWLGLTDCPNSFFLDCTYRQNLHKKTYGQAYPNFKKFQTLNVLNEPFFRQFNINKLKDINKIDAEWLATLQKTYIDGYSALGSAIMAENVTFEENKKFTQKLLDLNFKSTDGDKEIALIERLKRCQRQHIKTIWFTYQAQFCMEILHEIRNLIASFILESEELLLK